MPRIALLLLSTAGAAVAAGMAPAPVAPPQASAGAEARFDAGLALKEQRKWKEAEAAFRDATRERPDYAAAWSELGHALKMQQRYDDAVRAYERALAIQPTLAQAIEYLGEAYVAMGKRADAEKQLARLEPLDAALADRLRDAIQSGRIAAW